jgi:hypothetical protein
MPPHTTGHRDCPPLATAGQATTPRSLSIDVLAQQAALRFAIKEIPAVHSRSAGDRGANAGKMRNPPPQIVASIIQRVRSALIFRKVQGVWQPITHRGQLLLVRIPYLEIGI